MPWSVRARCAISNLDSRSKRASSAGIALAFVLAPPLPDGTISQGDRQHIAVSYSGILAEESNPFTYTGIPQIAAARTMRVEAARTMRIKAG